MTVIFNQSTVASGEYNSEEIAACIPVGDIAMEISKLQDQGYERKLIETRLKKRLNEQLSLWVAPISVLIFSRHEQSSKKVIKQAIGYCLQMMKAHKKKHKQHYVEA